MKENESLILEKLINIKCLNKCNLTVYLSNKFKVRKNYKMDLKKTKVHVNKDNDLVIKGVGFINFKNECEIELSIEDENLIEIRPSFFGGHK